MPKKIMKVKRRVKGEGIKEVIQWVDDKLKRSKIISTAGSILLPAGASALATALSFSPLGIAVGGGIGTAVNEFIKSHGYGPRRIRGRGLGTNKVASAKNALHPVIFG